MVTEVTRVCDFRQPVLVLKEQSTSKWQNVLRPQMQRDKSRKNRQKCRFIRIVGGGVHGGKNCHKMKVNVCFRSARGNDVSGGQSANGIHLHAKYLCAARRHSVPVLHAAALSPSVGMRSQHRDNTKGDGRQDARAEAGAHRASSGRLNTSSQLALRKQKFP